MFGSSHIVQQIAQQVSKATGLRSDLIMQMIPVVASIAIGGIAAAAQKQGWGGMLGQLANAASAATQSNPGTTGTNRARSNSARSIRKRRHHQCGDRHDGRALGRRDDIERSACLRHRRQSKRARQSRQDVSAGIASLRNHPIRPARRDRQDPHREPIRVVMRDRRYCVRCDSGSGRSRPFRQLRPALTP